MGWTPSQSPVATDQNRLETLEYEYLPPTLFAAANARTRRKKLNDSLNFTNLSIGLNTSSSSKGLGNPYLAAKSRRNFSVAQVRVCCDERRRERSLTLVLRSLSCVVAGKKLQNAEKNYILRQKP